jgi:ribonuclease BN (tRNA processing enzyme)
MSLRVVVLGSSGGYPGAGKACSGFLLQNDGDSLVLDIGSGVLSNLLKYIGPDEVDGLALSHLHYDHYVDIYGLFTARRFWEEVLPPLPVLAPPGAGEFISSMISEPSRPMFMGCMEMRELADGGVFEVGSFEVHAGAVSHMEESYGFRVTADERTLCYSGDSEVCDGLKALAQGVDLLICEATFTSEVAQKPPGHLSAIEAGEIAADAGAGRLLLTHVWPTLDPERAAADAREVFEGPVELAEEGLTLYVGPYPCAT